MQIVPLATVLAGKNILQPRFPFLAADCSVFETVLLQPCGLISASEEGIKHVNNQQAHLKFSSFLAYAKSSNADLAVTPEYSCPWQTLFEAIADPLKIPNSGALWVIGCESLTKSELTNLPIYEHLRWIYDENVLQSNGSFLDPVCYLFQTLSIEGQPVWIALLQFKTIEMADHISFIERNHLVKGRVVYRIENEIHSNALCTFICSDAFNIDDSISKELANTPTLLLHIQLNPEPRDPQFARYRQNSLSFASNEVEILTLNWANNTSFNQPYDRIDFSNSWGSAVYSKSPHLALDGLRIARNHDKGAFLCNWHERKTWSYYFDHCEAIYRLRMTPVSQRLARGQLAGRTGVEVIEVQNWLNNVFVQTTSSATQRFAVICQRYGIPSLCILNEGMLDVVRIERILALSLGRISSRQWHHVSRLLNFEIEDDETIKRLTCMLDASEPAVQHRNTCLLDYSRLMLKILANPNENLPDNLADLRGSLQVTYCEEHPNSNLYSMEMQRPATGVFVGTWPDSILPQSKYDEIFRCLTDTERRRFVVWFEMNGKFESLGLNRKPKITDTFASSNTAITSGFKASMENIK
jgi:hypothetical protein